MASSRRFDTVLYAIVGVLLIAVLGLAGYFGWTVYRDKIAAQDTTPALRVIKAMREQVKKAPNNAILRVRLGEALVAAGKPQEAIGEFNAALKIDPKHTGAFLDLGLVAMMNNRASEAQGYFQKVVDLTEGTQMEDMNQRRESAFYNLGLIALAQKEYDKAIGDFKAALRIRSDASDTYFYLARALDYSGQPDEAMRQLNSALAFDPNFAQARYFLGQLYLKKGDKVLAAEQFQRAAKASPQAKEPKEALKQLGDPQKLLAQAKSAMESDTDSALEEILLARNLDPTNVEILKTYAEILLARDNTKDALIAYKDAAKVAPHDAEIKAAIKRLSKQ